MKRTILLALCIAFTLLGYAHDLELDGIYYNFIDGKNEVTVVGSSKSDIIIPNLIVHEGQEYIVTTINQGAFYDRRDLESVQIGDSVKTIMKEAFRQCEGLKQVSFGKNVSTLGDLAFYNCTKIDSIFIPDSVMIIGANTFYGCTNLRYVEMGKKVRMLNQYAFYGCTHLDYVVFKKPIIEDRFAPTIYDIYFADRAFGNCLELKKVEIEDISSWCNSSANGTWASPLYYGADLYLNEEIITDLIIPEDVTSIGEHAFRTCPSIISATLPEKITVNVYSFNWSHIQTLRLKGGEDTHICNNAFYTCSDLIKVISESEIPPSIEEQSFSTDTYYKGTLYVPVGAKNAYKEAKGWSSFSNIKEGVPDANTKSYALIISVGSGGTVSYGAFNYNNIKQTLFLDEGEDATLTLLPYSGYVIDAVTVNGQDVTAQINDNKYTITNISSNCLVEITFKYTPIYLTIKQTNTPSITQEVTREERYNLSITPTPGYKITLVTFDNTDVTNHIVNNTYTTPKFYQSSELVIIQEPLKCQISCNVNEGGSIKIEDHTFSEGTNSTEFDNGYFLGISYEALEGYSLQKLFVDGKDVTKQLSNTYFEYGKLTKDICINAIFQKNEVKLYELSIYDADYGYSSTKVPEGEVVKYAIKTGSGWDINTILFNGIDVTSQIIENVYITPAIISNTVLSVSFVKTDQDAVKSAKANTIRVYKNDNSAIIENVSDRQLITVYDIDGKEIDKVIPSQDVVSIQLEEGKIYVIVIDNMTYKIAM